MSSEVQSVGVLFVDGDEAHRQTLGRIVGGRFRLCTANSGDEALELLESRDIAVLLADHRGCGMSGAELCARARVRWPSLVTMLTATYGEFGEIGEAMRGGHVAAYVPKPWSPAQVVGALDFAAAHSARTFGAEERISLTVARPRRSSHVRGSERAVSTILEWGPFRVDLLAQRLWVAGQEVQSAEPLQVRVLGCLIERAGSVWHRDALCARLYSQGSINSRALARAVWALRQRCGAARELIVSVRAVGYGLGIDAATLERHAHSQQSGRVR